MAKRTLARTAAAAVAALALTLLLVAPAGAQGALSSVEIHGFGGWAYAETDGLDYTLGDGDGRYDTAEFALNVSARPTENLSVVAQVYLESNDDDANEDKDVELDYAFAEWFVNDALKLRVGRVKHPFGLYGEVFDVGTLRPFYLLPQSIYGPNGYTAKAYNGVGITGSTSFGSGWTLQYDAYAGEIEGDFEVPGLLVATEEGLFLEPEVSLGFTVEDTVGGRLVLSTPVEGLSFGASAYTGDEQVGLETVAAATRTTWVLHGEYLADRWTVRTEWGVLENEDQFEDEGGYVELARKLTEHWEVAVRADYWEIDFPTIDQATLPAVASQVMEHDELAFGVNYWFNPGFVVRANLYQIEGNRFAFASSREEVAEALVTGQLEDETELIVLGAQFSF